MVKYANEIKMLEVEDIQVGIYVRWNLSIVGRVTQVNEDLFTLLRLDTNEKVKVLFSSDLSTMTIENVEGVGAYLNFLKNSIQKNIDELNKKMKFVHEEIDNLPPG